MKRTFTWICVLGLAVLLTACGGQQAVSPYDEGAILDGTFAELEKNTEEDGTFRTGEKWSGVWTRDISYSAILSLGNLSPDIIKKCLMVKVDARGRIIQDTGTGGSWPCSTDREVWAIAAWEVYLQTGDMEWLQTFYPIVERSLEADRLVAYNPESGLYRGESSFIDWREQSYPKWMESGDIAQSECLGTNAVFYRALQVMASASEILGIEGTQYAEQAESLKQAINENLWMPDKGYYGSFMYGRWERKLSPRSETLGESLCILWDIASQEQAKSIFKNMKVCQYGPTIFWPQIQDMGAYHNNAIWPFVTAFYGLAAAHAGVPEAMEFAIRSIWDSYLQASSNMENRVASDGSFGTLLNSPRQLWSIAGNLGVYYKGLLGLQCCPDGLRFAPVVPAGLDAPRTAKFHYRDAILTINVIGSGSHIRKIKFDRKHLTEAFIPASVSGRHAITIVMDGAEESADFELPVAEVTFDDADLAKPVREAVTVMKKPLGCKVLGSFKTDIEVAAEGDYYLDWQYANGNGTIDTYLNCANRTLLIDGATAGVCVFPQRGDSWDELGWSCPVKVHLTKGTHAIELRHDELNVNMGVTKDEARIHTLRLSTL